MSTILVVADQPDTRQTLCQTYLQGGFVVLEAKDSLTAFAFAEENTFDIIVLGLQDEPVGLETCSRFAHDFDIPILFITRESDIDAALNAGASNVVTGVHPRLLLHCTRILLDARQTVAQRQLAEALRDAAAILNTSLEIEVVLDRILTLIQDVIPSDLSTMYLIDNTGNNATTVRTISAKYPELIEEIKHVILPVKAIDHLAKMVETKQVLLIQDTATIPSWVAYPPTQWVRSVLSAPLQADGKVLGFIFLNAELPNTFTAMQSETLKIFADQASIAIINANRYKARSQDADEMKRQVGIRTAELEQKSRQLEAILESIGEGVQGVLFDEDNDNNAYTFINSALFDLFGYQSHEMSSLDQLRPDNVSEADFQAVTTTIFQTILQKKIWKGERRLKSKDGMVIDTGLVVSGLYSGDGRLIGVVSIFRDLSQQKALDGQKTRFVANAAHELRNPIAALKARLYLLKKQPEQLERHANILERIISQMENLVEDLLDLARFENGLIQLKDDVTELTSFVRDTILMMESEAESKSVWILDRLADEPVYVSIDPTRMMQVVMNLVSNAVKYTPEDSSVTISIQKGESGTASEGYMVMKIIDKGDGIPSEYLPHIFEPFYRVRTGGRGLGLGLAIIKEIVDLHGGQISVESEVGKGTTFTVLLKLVDMPNEPLLAN
ncbi:MAG: GAF domain-containing protein [Anaerolineaceae bacterium]|nr:GAF domain-containing protein [Anaerolineaceae bacterium]